MQSAAGNDQKRKAGTDLLIVDANGTFFIEGHGNFSFPALLRKQARHRSHCGCRCATCQYGPSSRIHNRRPPWVGIVTQPSWHATAECTLLARRAGTVSYRSSDFVRMVIPIGTFWRFL